MIVKNPQRLPDPQMAWARPDGRPTDAFYQYMRELDQAVRQIIQTSNENAITLEDFELRITDLETP